MFLPWDGGISAASQAALTQTVEAANKAGFEIKVAVIASPTDLGTATQLWRQPGGYGHFLGIELSELYGGQLLVVMPNGFGLYAPGSGPHKIGAAEAAAAAVKVPTPGTGDHMAQSAIDAVKQLATAAGHSFDGNVGTINAAPVSGGGSDWGAWLALALGALAILAAWIASLRARPLQWRRKAQA